MFATLRWAYFIFVRGVKKGRGSSVVAGCKPNSVRRRGPCGPLWRDDHSSRPVITHRLQQPTRRLRTGRPFQVRTRRDARRCSSASLFGLAPCGVLPATRVATSAVRSYRTFSPLPSSALTGYGAASLAACLDEAREAREVGRYFFCATFLQVALTGRYPAHCPSEFGLSSLHLGPCGLRRTAIVWPAAAVVSSAESLKLEG